MCSNTASESQASPDPETPRMSSKCCVRGWLGRRPAGFQKALQSRFFDLVGKVAGQQHVGNVRLEQRHILDRMRVARRVLQRVQGELGIGPGSRRRIALHDKRLFFRVKFFAAFSPAP